jgi:hypothetical protein
VAAPKHHHPTPLARYQKPAAITVTALLFPLTILRSIPSPPLWLRILEMVIESAVIVAVIFSITSTYRRRVFLFVLGTIALIASWAHIATPGLLEKVLGFLPSLFFWLVIFELMADVFRKVGDRTVKLLAAMNLYILASAAFARVYVLVDQMFPDSFRFGEGDGPSLASFQYFSIVTQTTLGYGDITPINPIARSIAAVQATLGVLYLAVIMAAIVGASRADHSHGS